MKVKVPLALLLLLAAAVGYMFGTEAGRLQRDVVLVKLGRKQEEGSEPDLETSSDSDDTEG
jgi:hypothetical protein